MQRNRLCRLVYTSVCWSSFLEILCFGFFPSVYSYQTINNQNKMKKLVLGFLFLSVGLVFARFSLFRGSADRVDHTTDANDDNNPDNINEIEVTALHEDDDDKTTALDALSFKSTVVGSSCCKCRNKCPAGPRGEPGIFCLVFSLLFLLLFLLFVY